MRLRSPHVHPFARFDVAHLLELQARVRPDHPFLVWAPYDGETRSWSYAQLSEEAARVAGGLARRGIRPGDRVVVHVENCPEAVVAFFALARLGATAVVTNARASGAELAYFAAHSAAVAAITQPHLVETLSTHCTGLRWIAVTGAADGAAGGPESAPTDSFSALGAAEPAPLRPADPFWPLAVLYTSGTTSRSKGVLLTHANGLWGAKVGAGHAGLTSSDRFLVHLPLYHVIGLSYSLLATLWAGGTVVLAPRFSGSRFWPTSVAHRCTFSSMVPFCVRALAGHEVPPRHAYRGWGNAFWSADLERRYGLGILGWWGMTEIVTHGIVGDPGKPGRTGAIGRPAPEYDLAVLRDDGTPTEPGETGNLLIRGIPGLSIFAEYLDDPDATAASFDSEGFFRTGDRVTVHPDGFIQFADRAKDVLKVGGENVSASEIERTIAAVDGVREAAVVGQRHPMLDEVPVAFVLVTGALADARPGLAEEILARCRAELAAFKVPRALHLVDELPRGNIEKVAKAELRRRANEAVPPAP